MRNTAPPGPRDRGASNTRRSGRSTSSPGVCMDLEHAHFRTSATSPAASPRRRYYSLFSSVISTPAQGFLRGRTLLQRRFLSLRAAGTEVAAGELLWGKIRRRSRRYARRDRAGNPCSLSSTRSGWLSRMLRDRLRIGSARRLRSDESSPAPAPTVCRRVSPPARRTERGRLAHALERMDVARDGPPSRPVNVTWAMFRTHPMRLAWSVVRRRRQKAVRLPHTVEAAWRSRPASLRRTVPMPVQAKRLSWPTSSSSDPSTSMPSIR